MHEGFMIRFVSRKVITIKVIFKYLKCLLCVILVSVNALLSVI